ncbi:MAG: exodeoxyribonuclease [Chloroflexota bacterium]|nr:exodeoxyribonuclease [Chloroflexota bacterium]
MRFGWGERPPAIAEVIRAQGADAVTLMEATKRSEVEWLARELGMDCFYGDGNHEWSVVWLSRLPIVRAANYPLAPLFHTLAEIEIQWDGRPLRLFGTHLRSFGPQSRIGVEARRRTAEAQAILEVLRDVGDQPHLLAGDFNSARPRETVAWREPLHPWLDRIHHIPYARRPPHTIVDAGYADCYRTLHLRGPGYTFRTDLPWERIDFIFASPSLAPHLTACDVATAGPITEASDHFPVWATFRKD